MRKVIHSGFSLCVGLLLWGSTPDPGFAQGLPTTVVIEGGTLIDGNGGSPVRDAQVLIQGNKIVRVGKKGQAYPPNAQVIKADGKFILPGLWDSQANFYSYQGEPMLNSGVTSFIGIGDDGEAGVFMHEGIVAGSQQYKFSQRY